MRSFLHIALLVLLITGGDFLPVQARQQTFTFDRLTTPDGLLPNDVGIIAQDHRGFMWFAADDGLQKYDGIRFTTYQHDPDDPNSLSDNRVRAIHIGRSGMIWIGTENGFNRFDPSTDRFEVFQHDPDNPNSLSNNRVRTIHEGRAGTLWVGTVFGGLNRFDPATQTFTHFLHDPEGRLNLSDRLIAAIHEDRSGNLWVGTAVQGLKRFDLDTQAPGSNSKQVFTTYPFLNTTYPNAVSTRIDAWATDDRRLASILQVGENQNLTQPMTLPNRTTVLVVAMGEGETGWGDMGWIENNAGETVWQMRLPETQYAGGAYKNRIQAGLLELTPGAYQLRYASDSGHSYGAWNSPPPDNPERWGIQVFAVTQEEARQFEAALAEADVRPKVSGMIQTIHEDPSGVLWIGTNAGLDRLDPSAAEPSTVHFEYDPNNPNSLNTAGVRAIQSDSSGILWIGGRRGASPYGSNGLTRFDPQTNIFTRFPYDPTDPEGFHDNIVNDVFVDRAGAVWIATQQNGVRRLDPSRGSFAGIQYDPNDPKGLSNHIVWSVLEDRSGMLWIGTDDGLNRLDRRTGQITYYKHDAADPGSLSQRQVKSLFEDQEGVLWVGTWGGGLNRFNPSTGRFTAYRPSTIYGGANRIELIMEDYAGMLWVSTQEGLYSFERDTGAFTRYSSDDLPSFFALYEDSQNVIWTSTHSGLNRLDRETGELKLYDTGRIHAVVEDSRGRFWIGGTDGLFRVDRETDQVERVSELGDLAETHIMGVVDDADGNLWISTRNQGLVRFNPDAGTVRTYGFADGLPITNFEREAFFESHTGEVYFAGPGGVVYFHPDQIRDNSYVPPVVLTDFRIREQSVPISSGGPLQTHISEAASIRLAHDQNDFTFAFAALNYTQPEKNQYAYFLQGYDEDWVQGGTNPEARYTNIPAGSYRFHVRASNNDGLWNEVGTVLNLTITPPFWENAWFQLLVALALFGLVYAGHRMRIQRLKAHSLELETQVRQRTAEVQAQAEKLQELDRIKSRFFANISHEFRTPLTLLLGPLQDALSDGTNTPMSHPQLLGMQRNGRRLLRLINQLLDLSKLEAGRMTLRARRADVIPLLRVTVQAFASLAERRHINLEVELPEHLELYFEADKLEKVCYNLLSNAFKFTDEGDTISLSLQEDETDVELVFQDTGHGIPAEELPYIFDRFHQVDDSSTRSQEGSGIGLTLTRELIALHGGTIRVESAPGVGTSFFVRLPRGRGHLADDEVDDAEAAEEIPDLDSEATLLHTVDDLLSASEAQAPESNAVDTPAPDAPLILIVEDNADVRQYLRRNLAADYRLVEADNGEQGLHLAQKHEPDLVLSDVMMPKMDGYDLCRAIKADASLNHIPVVLLTARADEESKVAGLETGADDYLYKPFNAEELLIRVENLIEIRRQLRLRFGQSVWVKPANIEITSTDEQFLTQVQTLVEAQLQDGLYSADQLADDVGLSRRQLDRNMKALTQLSASGYIRKMRLEHAAQLLQQGGYTVAEVAYAVGFQQVKYFSRLFQQTFGMLPSEYAEQG